MKKILLLILLIPSLVHAQTADDIIEMVDKNQLFTTQKYTVEMIIEKGTRKLVKNFVGYAKENGDKTFTEFTNREDLGVKYLKIENELWIYFPDADDILKISGHMLKQGMMGSDISYEDMLEKEEMKKKYETKLVRTEKVNDRDTYVIELNAKAPDASYERQILFVDKERYLPLKIEMYAKGGRLLKNMEILDIVKQGSRYIPQKVVIQDMRRRDSRTTLLFKEILFDISIPDKIFERRYLKK